MIKDKKRKRGRKFGRNMLRCAVYRSMKMRERSHIRRINRHLKKHPNDRNSRKALRRYKKLLDS